MTETSDDMRAADGTPLKTSLARALRRQKLRALLLIAPLLLFILVSFILPIGDMLLRSVENQIVERTLPRAVVALNEWTPDDEAPPEAIYHALYQDLFIAAEKKEHTRLGSRLNYEMAGISSLFRKSGRRVSKFAKPYSDALKDLGDGWETPAPWVDLFGDTDWLAAQQAWAADKNGLEPAFQLRQEAADLLPETAAAYVQFARFVQEVDEDSPTEEKPWTLLHEALYRDLQTADLSTYRGPYADELRRAQEALAAIPPVSFKAAFEDVDEDWGDPEVLSTIRTFAPPYTSGYYLAAADMELTPNGIQATPEDERIYIKLFIRTLVLSVTITFTCILLGYPIAWLLANLPMRTANILMILVLLPFWTSLLVRTSAWKVLLQQQGVINDLLVWVGLISDEGRLVMINNQLGTVIAMTHILLPFMILPLYSVMKTIPPSYLRAAKSLGATNWTAFWRVYFPQSIPGIGAGSILVFILAIGYYITPELVGGTDGTFISNRIAYHISTSLNWGLAAALGAILLVLVLALYWVYDRIVGIDNVKLG
ncbi:ABC transporter permease [Halovulum sp. GXIMD14793]